jgi:transposase
MDKEQARREQILSLHLHTSKTQREIASNLQVSVGLVNKVIKQHEELGHVKILRKGRSGRKPATTKQDDRFLVLQSRKNPRLTSRDLQKSLQQAGVEVSDSTVRRRLLKAGRRARRPAKKQLLTRKMKKKRLQWARSVKHMTPQDWRNVVFSDESHFVVQGITSRYVRRSNGEALTELHIDQCTKHPPKKMFWACFTYKGVGPIFPTEGMMNSAKYQALIDKKLIPYLRKEIT